MTGLFEAEYPEAIADAARTLERAEESSDVPYPFNQTLDCKTLLRIQEKYPELDLLDMVEKFIAWCTDTTPWLLENGKPARIRWRSRLWTWAVNEERYRLSQTRRLAKARTHRAAEQDHTVETEASERW